MSTIMKFFCILACLLGQAAAELTFITVAGVIVVYFASEIIVAVLLPPCLLCPCTKRDDRED